MPAISTTPAAIDAFFNALEQHDIELVRSHFTEDATEVIPLSSTGVSEPFATFTGRDAVLGYLQQIVTMFSRVTLVGRNDTVSADGDTVFVEARGDLINAATGTPYNNIYLFKFVLREGLITHVSEYANPVTFAKMAGIPVG